jgi:hypothetical protein
MPAKNQNLAGKLLWAPCEWVVLCAVQFFIRDILGMAGGIIFAYAAGSNFDSNAKQWRLFADIMNDIGERLQVQLRMLSCTARKLITASPHRHAKCTLRRYSCHSKHQAAHHSTGYGATLAARLRPCLNHQHQM